MAYERKEKGFVQIILLGIFYVHKHVWNPNVGEELLWS